jgi:hypothetical protein
MLRRGGPLAPPLRGDRPPSGPEAESVVTASDAFLLGYAVFAIVVWRRAMRRP